MNCSPPGSSVHGDSTGKYTGVGCHFFLQGTFPTQGSNPGVPHCRWIFYCLNHQGRPHLCIFWPKESGQLSSLPHSWYLESDEKFPNWHISSIVFPFLSLTLSSFWLRKLWSLPYPQDIIGSIQATVKSMLSFSSLNPFCVVPVKWVEERVQPVCFLVLLFA